MQSSVSPTMNEYLSGCTPEELNGLLAAIKVTKQRASKAHHRNTSQSTSQSSSQSPQSTPPRKPQGIKKRSPKARSPKTAAQKHAPERVAKRPLNSFIAFRSFYAGIFVNQQQKNISGFLTQLWAADTQKAKFSLLAKAYSMIRDLKGKRDAPLDVFLSVTCPKIGIVSAKDYLAVFGWQVRTHGDGQVTLDRSSATVALSNQMCTTNMSVRDLIDHCKDTMYITDDDVRCITEPGGTDGAPDLVMAALPSDRDSKTRKSSPSKARSASPVRMLSNTNHSLPHYASMPSPILYHQSAAPAYMFGFSHDNVLVNGTSNNLAYHSLDYHSQQPRVTINHTSPMQTSTPVSNGSGTIDPRLFPGTQRASNVSYDSNLSPGFAGQPTQPSIWAGNVASLPSASYAQGSGAHYDHNDIFDPSSGDPFDAYNISSFGDHTSMDDKSFWQL